MARIIKLKLQGDKSMGKNVIDNKVINPNNENEMVDLFMYEKLKDIKKYVNESELIIFFDRMFNKTLPKRGYDRIIQQLERKLGFDNI